MGMTEPNDMGRDAPVPPPPPPPKPKPKLEPDAGAALETGMEAMPEPVPDVAPTPTAAAGSLDPVAPAVSAPTRARTTAPAPAAHSIGPAPAKWRWPSIHPEGLRIGGIAAGIGLLAFLVGWSPIGWGALLFAAATATFFRDPVRASPAAEGLILSPADGLVSQIVEVELPRQVLGDGGLTAGRATRISVFMSVFDVHINRAPIGGTVSRMAYVPGAFVNADLDKASEENERQYFVMQGADGTLVAFTQIAGLIARRIVGFVREGTMVAAGQRVGLIRFGSRVDVFLPAGYQPQVVKGQRAIAGETVLAARDRPAVLPGAHQ